MERLVDPVAQRAHIAQRCRRIEVGEHLPHMLQGGSRNLHRDRQGEFAERGVPGECGGVDRPAVLQLVEEPPLEDVPFGVGIADGVELGDDDAFGDEATRDLEAVQQPVGVGGIAARLELPQPRRTASRRVSTVSSSRCSRSAPKPGRRCGLRPGVPRRPARRRRSARSSSWPAGMVRV